MVEGLEKELASLESEAGKLAKEIEELTGAAAPGSGRKKPRIKPATL